MTLSWLRREATSQMPSNLAYFTGKYKTDKVVYESPVLEYSVGGGATNTATIANPYGKKAFITLAFSTNGSDYYPAQAYVTMTNTYTANGWVDANNVYIYCENNSGGTINFYVKYVLDAI